MSEEENDYPLSETDLEHLSNNYRTKMKNILKKYKILYYGTFGEVFVTDHVMNLQEGSKTVRQLPYCAGPGSREVVKYNVEKMLKLGVIKLTSYQAVRLTSRISTEERFNLHILCQI